MVTPKSKISEAPAKSGSSGQFGAGDHSSSAHSPENVGDNNASQKAAQVVLQDVPKGTIVVAGIAVAIVFFGWLLTFFLLFLPRGYIG